MTDVLVVDDDPRICDLIGALFHNQHVRLEYASTAQSGANRLRTRRFDLAILDAMLSEISGPELEALAANENVPILFMTLDPADGRFRGSSKHAFIEKKSIKDHLLQQFAQIILENRPRPVRVKSRVAAGADLLFDVIDEPEYSRGITTAERHCSNMDNDAPVERGLSNLATDGGDVMMAPSVSRIPVVPSAPAFSRNSHLGTLVRRHHLATFEIRFSLEDDTIVVVATRANKPVPLDFNTTVKELVALGWSIFTHSAVRLRKATPTRGT